MIGLSRLKRAIGVNAGGMQTGDLKVKLRLCDAQRIEVEYAALIAERDAALAQNAELVAQVEILLSKVSTANKYLTKGFKSQQFDLVDCNHALCALAEAEKCTPTQCLRDIQAEAGRAGFIACAVYYHTRIWMESAEQAAEKYAERVKAGE